MMLIMVDQPSTPSTPSSGIPLQSRWITSAEAASALGVQERSLYAYVSRGMIRSVRGPSGRQRLYSGEDLERLRARKDARSGHGAVAAGALQFGEAVLDSAITEITAEGPSYRGYLARELAARHVPYENVAELLWSGALVDGVFRWPRVTPLPAALRPAALAKPARPARPAGAAGAASGAAIFDSLLCVPLAMARRDPDRGDARADAMARCGRLLIPQLALASNPAATEAERARAALADGVAAMMAAVWRLPARAIPILDAALVLCADHELNPSTFAARVAAGTGADPYAVVAAGLATLSGPRHGSASLAAGRFLAEVGKPGNAAAAVRALRQRQSLPPAFGHRVYSGTDPRALSLFALAEQLAPNHPLVRTSQAIVAAVAKDGDGEHPNVDFAMVTLAAALGAPFEITAAWYGVGRCAGFLAHATEQRTGGALLRPRARYTGPAVRALEYAAALPVETRRPKVRGAARAVRSARRG
jgi:citrate synthase